MKNLKTHLANIIPLPAQASQATWKERKLFLDFPSHIVNMLGLPVDLSDPLSYKKNNSILTTIRAPCSLKNRSPLPPTELILNHKKSTELVFWREKSNRGLNQPGHIDLLRRRYSLSGPMVWETRGKLTFCTQIVLLATHHYHDHHHPNP